MEGHSAEWAAASAEKRLLRHGLLRHELLRHELLRHGLLRQRLRAARLRMGGGARRQREHESHREHAPSLSDASGVYGAARSQGSHQERC